MEIKTGEAPTPCRDSKHEPANMVYRTPGTYQHTCPSCGTTTTFEVPLVTY